MWLDGLIASKAISPSTGVMDVVFYAAVYRAFQKVKESTKEALASMQKGQLVLLGKRRAPRCMRHAYCRCRRCRLYAM